MANRIKRSEEREKRERLRLERDESKRQSKFSIHFASVPNFHDLDNKQWVFD